MENVNKSMENHVTTALESLLKILPDPVYRKLTDYDYLGHECKQLEINGAKRSVNNFLPRAELKRIFG